MAVSGGSDSLALLHAIVSGVDRSVTEVSAVTVDHGLRAAAKDEADFVARVAADLNVSHDVLQWRGWDGAGNLLASARDARYDLMTEWARTHDIPAIALGHTADDQAETVLMRLARSAGVDGLSGIPSRRLVRGIALVRPFLSLSRETLRSYLMDLGQTWIDDPTNEDPKYERVRLRAAARQLADLGLTAQALADVAGNMADARDALDWYTFLAARDTVQLEAGDVRIDLRRFRTTPDEIARRLLVHALRWVGGGPYTPRRDAVRDTLTAIRLGKTATLHGCTLLNCAQQVWICREFNSVAHVETPVSEVWDRRWRVTGRAGLPDDLRVRALGADGLSQCTAWRETGRPRPTLLASPSVWQGDRLLAAPHAGFVGTVGLELLSEEEDFFASILSH